jgi:hypothetical protein
VASRKQGLFPVLTFRDLLVATLLCFFQCFIHRISPRPVLPLNEYLRPLSDLSRSSRYTQTLLNRAVDSKTRSIRHTTTSTTQFHPLDRPPLQHSRSCWKHLLEGKENRRSSIEFRRHSSPTMANQTRGLCPEPFFELSKFPTDGGFVDGRLCQHFTDEIACCLPCPMTEWVYPDNFGTLTSVGDWVATASAICCVFLLLSWLFLPVEKTNRHYLSICLTIPVALMNVGSPPVHHLVHFR